MKVLPREKYGITLFSGLASGDLIHTIAAVTGLAIIFRSSECAFQIIKLPSAFYMFYLAVQTVLEKQLLVNLTEGEYI